MMHLTTVLKIAKDGLVKKGLATIVEKEVIFQGTVPSQEFQEKILGMQKQKTNI